MYVNILSAYLDLEANLSDTGNNPHLTHLTNIDKFSTKVRPIKFTRNAARKQVSRFLIPSF